MADGALLKGILAGSVPKATSSLSPPPPYRLKIDASGSDSPAKMASGGSSPRTRM
jgi:hypothetical protein